MIEFDKLGTEKLYNLDALKLRIVHRLTMYKREIPYLDIGIEPFLFTYKDIAPIIQEALSDLGIRNIQINDEKTRIRIANIVVDVSDILSKLNEGV